MPLYEYQCRACDQVYEVRHEWKAPAPPCPECGSADVKKVLHAAALVFKGSGWHVNDYGKHGANGGGKSRSNGSAPESKSSDSSASTASSSSSTESSTPSSTSTTPAPAAAKKD